MAGDTFKRGVKAPLPPGSVISSPLGDTISTGFAQNDVGKAIKFQAGAVGSAIGVLEAVLCVDGDPIEGFVSSVEPNTVNEGYSFGGCQVKGQYEVARGATAVTIALGDFVVMDGAQAALGTAEANVNVKGYTRLATDLAGIPLWQCTQHLVGIGDTAGDILLIERVA
jgi:hypothetical protein